MPTQTPNRTTWTLNDKEPLAYSNGAEKTESIIIDRTVVEEDEQGKRVLPKGALLVQIDANDAYGPYDEDALDGRQTLGIAPKSVILTADVEVTTNPQPIGGYFSGAAFKLANLTLYGADPDDVKAAFPRCDFL